MKRIAVIPNNSKDIGLVNTKRLVEFLNGKAEIYIDEAYSVLGFIDLYLHFFSFYGKIPLIIK